MFGSKPKDLVRPPIARTAEAHEVMRVWSDPDGCQEFVVQTTWEEPAIWGLVLADAARHVAKAYSAEGVAEEVALGRILELFAAEIGSPTDEPVALTS